MEGHRPETTLPSAGHQRPTRLENSQEELFFIFNKLYEMFTGALHEKQSWTVTVAKSLSLQRQQLGVSGRLDLVGL